jgi:hypothetical protein
MPHPTIGREPSISAQQYYAIVRGQIEHEDNLIGQRLSWLVAAQAFLFTAYAITVSNSGPNHTQPVIDRMRLLLWIVPITAILTCALIYATIIAGSIAIVALRRLYHSHADHSECPGLPPVLGYRRTLVLGQIGPLLLPLVFLAGWLILLLGGVNL